MFGRGGMEYGIVIACISRGIKFGLWKEINNKGVNIKINEKKKKRKNLYNDIYE